MTLYLDSSAVAKALRAEPGHDVVDMALRDPDRVATSVISYAETCAALARSSARAAAISRARAELDRLWGQLHLIPVDDEAARSAGAVAQRRRLRGPSTWQQRSSGPRPSPPRSPSSAGTASSVMPHTLKGSHSCPRCCDGSRPSRPTIARSMERAPLDREEFLRWREEADRALQSGRQLAAAGTYNWACFMSEQAAQLVLKALLHGIGAGPWGHDLVALGRSARSNEVAVPSEIDEALGRLSRHYIPARYPDAHPGGSPGSRYTAADAAAAISDAEAVLAWVDRTWAAYLVPAMTSLTVPPGC